MARKWTDAQFGKRVRAEREHRGWTQAELANMLTGNGIAVGPTVIAKIEVGKRSVRIDEAFELANLFGLSLDILLGRVTDLQNDLAYVLRSLVDLANQSAHQVSGVAATLRERFADVAELDFEGRDTVISDGDRAFDALQTARAALTSIANFALPPQASLRPIDPEQVRDRAELAELYRQLLRREQRRARR